MRARRLSVRDQAFFIFGNLEARPGRRSSASGPYGEGRSRRGLGDLDVALAVLTPM